MQDKSWTNRLPSLTYIRMTKVKDLGTIDHHEIYEGYQVEGYMAKPPVAGQRFSVLRTVRNGVQRLGEMTTSTVQEVLTHPDGETISFSTLNSNYRLQVIEEPLDT